MLNERAACQVPHARSGRALLRTCRIGDICRRALEDSIGAERELVLEIGYHHHHEYLVGRPLTLRPGEAEIIGSNLDSGQTAQLFEKARNAFEAEVAADPALQQLARSSAEQSLRSLFTGLGFRDVAFVEKLSPEPKRG